MKKIILLIAAITMIPTIQLLSMDMMTQNTMRSIVIKIATASVDAHEDQKNDASSKTLHVE